MSVPVESLPPSYTYGKVIGRVLRSMADTAEDVDDKPQARPASGKVIFTPKETLRKVADDGAGHGAFIASGVEEATLSSSGRILDGEGRQGIWLVTGEYVVSFKLDATPWPVTITPFEISVTAAHTEGNELDLALAAPVDPPAGTVLQTVAIPDGGTVGQVLSKAAGGGLAWLTPSVSVADVTGLLAALSAKADAAATTTALAGKADATATTTALAGKADVSALAAKADASAMTTALAAKADATALAAKADATTVVTLTGNQTIAGIKTLNSAPVVPDGSWTIAKTTGLQAALDAKGAVKTVNGTAPDGTGNVTVSTGASDWASIAGKPAVIAAGADAAAARTAIGAGTSNLALGTTASTARAGNWVPASTDVSDATTTGRAVLTSASAAAARTAIGAGTSSLAVGATATDAKAGNWIPAAADISDATAVGRSVVTAATPAAARTAIGAGTSNLAVGTTAADAKAGDWAPAIADVVGLTAALAGKAPSSHTHTIDALPAGTVVASTAAARPTARTDIPVLWLTATDPGSAAVDGVDVWVAAP